MRNIRYLLILLLCAALTGCTALGSGDLNGEASDRVANGTENVRIVCTSFPCYDFARAVAGENADVRMLIRPGGEVHAYEPTPTDILDIAGCDLFIYIGGESDVWVDSILESFGEAAPQTLRLFDCVEALEEETLAEMTFHEAMEEEEEPEYDEHIWTSPKNAVRMLRSVAEALGQILPQDAVAANAGNYIAQIEDLDAQIRELIQSAKRDTLVFADRFPLLYFVREYGLNYTAAFPSCTSESEPSAHTVAALIDRIRAEEIPVVFQLELSSGRVAQSIAGETGAAVRTFYSVQNITQTDFERGETYITLMEKNIDALKEALN